MDKVLRESYMVRTTLVILQGGIEVLLDQIHDALELREPFQCVELGLDWDHDLGGRGEGVDRDEPERRGTIDEDVVKIALRPR